MSKKKTNKKVTKKVVKKVESEQPDLIPKDTDENDIDNDTFDDIHPLDKLEAEADNFGSEFDESEFAEDAISVEMETLRDKIVEEAKKIASNQISHCYDLVIMGRELIEMEKE